MTKTRTEAEVKEHLLLIAENKRKAFESAQAKMLEAVKVNPQQAVEWDAKHIIETQATYYEVWEPLVRDLEEHSVKDALAAAIEATEMKVGWTLGGGSTCPFHRAIERTKGDVLFRQLGDLRQMVDLLNNDE
jgi:nitrogen fixation protein FixH